MENKRQRLAQITKIIQKERVTSQEELLHTLISLGYSTTQATLSRDLKLLKVAKMPDGQGSYRYVMPNAITSEHIQPHMGNNSLEGLLSIEFSGNMGVIKTVPAFSHTVALALDNAGLPEIAGTLAGNDTILFVIRQGYSDQEVSRALKKQFPDIVDKLL